MQKSVYYTTFFELRMYRNFKNSVGMALLQNQLLVDTAVWNKMSKKGTKEEYGIKEDK